MAIGEAPQWDVFTYVNQINAYGNALDLANFHYGQGAAQYFDSSVAYLSDFRLTVIANQVIHLFNLQEQTYFVLADQLDVLSAILAQGPGGGSVDLGNLEFYLQSILRDTSNIAVAVGGGAPTGIGDIVNVLDQRLYDLWFEATQNRTTLASGLGGLINVLSAGVPGTLGHAVDSRLGDIGARLSQIVTLMQLTAGAGDPSTAKLASTTEEAAAVDAIIKVLSTNLSQPSVESLANSAVRVSEAGLEQPILQLLQKLGPVLGALLGTTLGQTAIVSVDNLVTGGKITAQLVDGALWAIDRGADWIAKLALTVLGAAGEVTKAMSPAMDRFFDPVLSEMVDSAQALSLGIGEVGPSSGFNVAKKFVTAAAKNGLHAHNLATAIELVPFFHHFGMHQVSSFLADMAAFAPIAGQTWGKAIGEGIGRAAGYEINASMRSKLPSESEIEQMVFEGQMTLQEQSTLLAYHGYSDRYIQAMQAIQYREPTLTQITRLAADATMDESQVNQWLTEGGFSPADAQKIAPIVMQQSMRTERGALLTEVMSNLKAGYIGRDDADFYFDRLRLTPAARAFLFDAAALGFRRDAINDNLTTLKAQHAAGLIDTADFQLALTAQGIEPVRIAVEVAAVDTKRAAKVAQEEKTEVKAEIRKEQSLLVQQLRASYGYGFIDAPAFELALIQAGIDAGVARLTVSLEETKLAGRFGAARAADAAQLTEREIAIRQQAYTEYFQKGLINVSQFQNALSALGLDPRLVDAIVQREQARAVKTPGEIARAPEALKAKELVTLAKTTYQVNFRKGLIDANRYLQALVQLGVDPAIAQATVNLEVSRRQAEADAPAPADIDTAVEQAARRQFTALVTSFVDRRISEQTLRSELQRLGAVPLVIEALVQEAIEKRALKETAKGAEI